MSVSSLSYLIFVAVGVVLYYALPKQTRPYILLALSIFFILTFNVASLIFAICEAAVIYVCGLLISKEIRRGGGHKKLFCGLGIFLIIGTLVFLKFANTALGSFGIHIPFGEDIGMPLAISYYTLQAYSYLMDCYWERIPAEKNPFKILLFVTFFPQMLQGPISRYGQLGKELANTKRFDPKNLKYGVQLMLWGYFKLLVISSRAGSMVWGTFHGTTPAHGWDVLLGLITYGIQLYCSFSGGIDIIRGTAQCFGIDMAENFRQPFFSTSLGDFWRRWHITLGAWMKDYIFYPFVLSRPVSAGKKFLKKHTKIKRKMRESIFVAIGDVLVFFLVGLWHGSGSAFIAWGLYNGIIIGFNQLMEGPYKKAKKKLNINVKSPAWIGFTIVRTFIVITIGWVFDCAPTASGGIDLFLNMFNFAEPYFECVVWLNYDTPFILSFIAVLIFVDIMHERGISIRDFVAARPFWVQIIFWALWLIVVVGFSSTPSETELLYAVF